VCGVKVLLVSYGCFRRSLFHPLIYLSWVFEKVVVLLQAILVVVVEGLEERENVA
jgi:hypothetical protein